jgi:hypothetical protein
MATKPVSSVVLISERAYRLLLRLYPRRFREEHGLHMSRTFRDCSREQYQRDGILGLIGLWMFTAMDVIKTALEERAHTGEWLMSKQAVIRIGGPAMIIAGILWMVVVVGSAHDQLWVWTWFIAFPPMLIGLYALTVYAGRNDLMRIGAWVAVAACASAWLGATLAMFEAAQFPKDEWWLWVDGGLIWAVSALLTVMGVLVFGIGALRAKPLPRWNGAALLLVPLVLFAGLDSLGFRHYATLLEAPIRMLAGEVILPALIGLPWVLLGCAMLPSKNCAAAPAQS